MDRIDQRFTCTVCGSELRFGPGQNRLACPHCGREQSIPGTPASRLATQRGHPIGKIQPAAATAVDGSEFPVTACHNCGATIDFDGVSYASDCPYCGSSVVHRATESSHFAPKAILPFAITEEEAHRFVMQRLKDDALMVPGIPSDIRLRPKLKGVLLPFWVFGADSETDFSIKISRVWYEKTTSSPSYDETFMGGFNLDTRRTEWTVVDDRLRLQFGDVLVRAAANPPPPFDTGLGRWDLAALVPYQRDYVAGLYAELASISPADAHREAREKMHAELRQEVKRVLGAEEVHFMQFDTRFAHETFKLVLLPFWIADYGIEGRTCRAFVNGQSGAALAQVGDRDPKIGWSGGWVMLMMTPILLALSLIFFGVFGTMLEWYDWRQLFDAP